MENEKQRFARFLKSDTMKAKSAKESTNWESSASVRKLVETTFVDGPECVKIYECYIGMGASPRTAFGKVAAINNEIFAHEIRRGFGDMWE